MVHVVLLTSTTIGMVIAVINNIVYVCASFRCFHLYSRLRAIIMIILSNCYRSVFGIMPPED